MSRVTRIEVAFKPELRDARGEKVARRMREFLGLQVEAVRTVRVYLVEGDFPQDLLERYAYETLCDPVIQRASVNRPLAAELNFPFDWVIEVGFRPGVTDNEGRVAAEALALLIERTLDPQTEGVYSAMQYLLKGKISREEAEKTARELLANELIERWWILSREEYEKGGLSYPAPRVTEFSDPTVETWDLKVLSDDELMRLSRERLLALSLSEMQTIRDFFSNPDFIAERKKYGLGPEITDVELESLAQTWSEHCKHKIFNARIHYRDLETGEEFTVDSIFKTYIRGSTEKIREKLGPRDFCLSVFVDNAGVIKLNDHLALAFKVETHNSPSALDPYGGALTGIVGVNRDPFGTGKGALLVFNTDIFCFAPPNWDKPLPPRLLHPRRIFEGVREGVEHGGNQSGIPTVNGSIVFDPRYLGKPLVFCGTGGILPLEVCGEPSWKKGARPGDLVVMVGGRIGKDGIHGATFSSEALHEGSPATAVQIGDPITQKKMTDFLLKARDECLYTSITDNGAGGLSSSVGEMAREAGGAELDLEKPPLKYPGLRPWEILLSESQERMTVAVPPEKIDRFLELARKMDVEATVVGRFTDSGYFHLKYQGKTVGLLPLKFLHEGVPQMELQAEWQPPRHTEPDLPEPEDLGAVLKEMLSRLNVCSKEYVVRQYDHEVQGGSVVKPLTGVQDDGPSDAAVLRPDLSRQDGIAVAHGICPKFSDIDTYWMAANAIDEAIRNAVCVGGDIEHMAGLDNFCWCDPIESEKTPDGRYKLAQLVRATKAVHDFTVAYGVPCISGKDSMKNDYLMALGLDPKGDNPYGVGVILPDGSLKISVPPTLLFSIVARVPDVTRAQTMDVKHAGDLLYILGMTRDELGGSEYYASRGFVGSSVPRVNAEEARERYLRLREAIYYGLVASAHDASDGGLAVALAEKAFSGGLGLFVDLSAVPYEGSGRPDFILFSESASRILVTVPREKQRDFEKLMEGTTYAQIGEVIAEPVLIVRDGLGRDLIRESLSELKAAWQTPLREV
ncbi:AIR synthase-related protein [Thermosulfurimonas dismutans]|uniref:Phosphoribosylformylglycinamidine synthase subunit PurL n=1 Tax=Thermosulfurimonas dismutans TaxID=999894 RepID=A0A179D1H9_9BACT|nr:AIR synthase-related protein [Thermosulfurimonas dismutans]OAQ19924.1 Phosphoribosylformylglycinamidine synthase, PurS subunit [Thermosulfurimonas dismutans]